MRRTDWIGELIRVAATLLFAGGLLAMFTATSETYRGDRPLSLDVRFQTDNAAGATANAVEWMAEHNEPAIINNGIWLSLFLWLLWSVRRTQLSIDRLCDLLAPKRDEQPATAKGDTLARRAGEAVAAVIAPRATKTSAMRAKEST